MERDGNLQADERDVLLARARGSRRGARGGAGAGLVPYGTSGAGGASGSGGGAASPVRSPPAVSEQRVSEDFGSRSPGGPGMGRLGQLFGGPRA